MARILCLLVILSCLLVSGALSAPNWIIYLRAYNAAGGSYEPACMVGAHELASDGIDTIDRSRNSVMSNTAVVSTFDLGMGGSGYGWLSDMRAVDASNTTWQLTMWVQPGYATGKVVLKGWNPVNTNYSGGAPLCLKVVDDPTGTYPADTVIYTWDGTTSGSDSSPEFAAEFENAEVLKAGPAGGVKLVLTRAVSSAQMASIGVLKTMANGTAAGFEDAIVVATTANGFYAESQDRSAGMRVISGESVLVGDCVRATGSMGSVAGERVLNADDVIVVQRGCELPRPLGMRGRDLGSAIGKIVRVWGKVVDVDPGSPAQWFDIDDASGARVRCRMTSGIASTPGSIVAVTGVCVIDGPTAVLSVLVAGPAA